MQRYKKIMAAKQTAIHSEFIYEFFSNSNSKSVEYGGKFLEITPQSFMC